MRHAVLQHVKLFPFIRPNNIPLCVYSTFCLSIHLLEKHLGFFHFGAILNNVSMTMVVYIYLPHPVFNSSVARS